MKRIVALVFVVLGLFAAGGTAAHAGPPKLPNIPYCSWDGDITPYCNLP